MSSSKFDFVKRTELPQVFESDVSFLEGIINYLEEKRASEIHVDSEKENCAYKIKRMPTGFSRALRNKTRMGEGKWTVELKDGKTKQSLYLDEIPEEKMVWGLVQESMDVWPQLIVLLDVEGREWPVDVADSLKSVLNRKMCILEFPTFVILH